ncbi:MAG: ATPase P [Sarcina sp.]|nr:ATPase P [Sarcina sp.]
MYKVLLKIDGMSCSMCEAHMNDTIRSRYSVNKLKSSFKKGTTEFLVQEAPSEEDLRALIDPTGYRLISCTVEKEGNEEKPRASLFGFLKR